MGGFAGYYGQTLLHPFALTAVLVLGLAVLVLSRRFALVPLLIAATTIPMAQRMVIAGADFTLLRLLLIAYVLRIVFRGEWREFRWNPLDTAIVLWVVSGTLIMTIHFGTADAFINRLGWAYDILLTYFCGRCLLRQWSDLISLARSSVMLSIPIAAVFLVEWTTQYNLFSVFGGVPEVTRVTEGRLRCQGPFAHPILAGAFWAALLPLIWTLWNEGRGGRGLTYLGTAAVLAIVFASSSSTSIASVGAAFVGVALFAFRRDRKAIWIGVILIAAILHFVIMKQPIWHLMGRLDILGGSTGWHRFKIFDVFVNHFSEWWLTGHSNPTAWHWFMRDITNQYILEGLRGGLLTLFAFLMVLARAFGNIGKSLAIEEKSGEHPDRVLEWKIWLAGVAILVHAVTFFGVSYFAQMIIVFYLQLAIAGAIGAGLVKEEQLPGEMLRGTARGRQVRRLAQ